MNPGPRYHAIYFEHSGRGRGKETVAEILKIDPEAGVVVSSDYFNDPVMAYYTDHGFCAAIVKPYRLQDLGKMIGQLACEVVHTVMELQAERPRTLPHALCFIYRLPGMVLFLGIGFAGQLFFVVRRRNI